MASSVMDGFLDRVWAAVGPADDPRTDAQLLAAFGDRREAGAFAVLVRRYGALVWAVCRRGAGDAHAAEDAFQATFLVLARRAGDIRPQHSAGGWLHRTATHIALRARAMAARRARHERPRGALTDPAAPEPAEPADPAALAALDEEIARLPEVLRAAVVLCELQGTPRRSAAARLGVAEGTVSSRLAAARRRLADRLRRRGFAPVAGVPGLMAAGRTTEAAAPAGLVAVAVKLGEGSVVPRAVCALADKEVRAMLLLKLVPAAAGAVVLAAAVAGLWPAATPSAPAATTAAAPAKPQPREGVIVLTSFGEGPPIELINPDGTPIGEPAVGAAAYQLHPGDPFQCPLWLGRLSPDGKRLAAVRIGPLGGEGEGVVWTRNHLWVFDLGSKDGPDAALMADLRHPVAAWSADGGKLYGSHIDPEKVKDPREQGKPIPLVSWVYDFATKTKAPLAVPAGHEVRDVSPDGKSLLTVVTDAGEMWPQRSYLVPLDTLKPRPLADQPFDGLRLSPDGKRVLGNRSGKKGAAPPPLPLAVVSVADGAVRPVPLVEGATWAFHACWSPDGRRVAYHWHEEVPSPPDTPDEAGGPGKRYASRVTVSDVDGRNARTIVRREHDQRIMGLDWK